MRTRNTVSVALFAALLVVLSLVPPVPMPGVPVPVTLQLLGVILAGCMLGPVRGPLAVLLYLVLAAIGLPVLPGGRGGLGVFAGPTGGFLVGMLVGSAVCGGLARLLAPRTDNPFVSVVGNFVGAMACVAVVYAIGTPWLAAVTGIDNGKAMMGMLPFVPVDVAKAGVGALVAYRVQRVWPMYGR